MSTYGSSSSQENGKAYYRWDYIWDVSTWVAGLVGWSSACLESRGKQDMLCYVIYNYYTRDCHFDELEVEYLEYSEFAGQFIVN